MSGIRKERDMATIPEQYESQRVGVQGYRVLNLDLDGVCADYKGAIRDYLQRQGIDVPERALQTAHYNLMLFFDFISNSR